VGRRDGLRCGRGDLVCHGRARLSASQQVRGQALGADGPNAGRTR
jgi:hypothetical protein